MTIYHLPDNLTTYLRSSQSIPTVSCCVSECVQNSVDGNATTVEISVNCSTQTVTITDNGEGIEPHDMENLCTRYTTSKCSHFEDLDSVSTYGFRGEALANIASISLLTIVSRHKLYQSTQMLRVNHSKKMFAGPISTDFLTHGTIVTIQNLFGQMPVRRNMFLEGRFLSDKTLRDIKDAIVEVALCSPGVNFKMKVLTADSVKDVFSAVPSRRSTPTDVSILRSAYGHSVLEKFCELKYTHKEFSVSGILSLRQSASKHQYICMILYPTCKIEATLTSDRSESTKNDIWSH